LKRSIWIIITILALIIGLTTGIFGASKIISDKIFIPELKITGDVRNIIKISDPDIFKDTSILNTGGYKIDTFSLRKLIDYGEPFSQQNKILVTGCDGKTAELDYEELSSSYIAFDSEDGWHSINLKHPVSTKIKRIKEIAVIAKGAVIDFEYGLSVIDPDENLLSITPGQAYGRTTEYLELEGDVSMEKDGDQLGASIYSKKKVLGIEELLDNGTYEKLVVMGRDGNIIYTGNTGLIELEDNHFNYIDGLSGEITVNDLAGIMIDYPGASITDVYHDSIYYLGRGDKVMVIILDGFGYHQYKHAAENGYIPFMENSRNTVIASSVFRPVTNAGLAAMFTGKPPAENGIHDREDREPMVPTVFNNIVQDNKKALYIEGDIQILKTEIEPVLNIDHNNDGYIDDDIFRYSMENINDGFDFVVIHFHSIDDMGHDYGDIVPETMDTIKRLDSYVDALVSGWDGQVIVTADHGMHTVSDGGSHGEFRYEDMFVPYIVFSVGQ